MEENKKEMIPGIQICFRKENNRYFEDEWDNDIDADLLIISLLETINDICEDNNLDMKEKVNTYLEMGSVDNYSEGE